MKGGRAGAERLTRCRTFTCGRRPGERHADDCQYSARRQEELASGCRALMRRRRYLVPGTSLTGQPIRAGRAPRARMYRDLVATGTEPTDARWRVLEWFGPREPRQIRWVTPDGRAEVVGTPGGAALLKVLPPRPDGEGT